MCWQVCRAYGFYEQFCPFIYTLEGELIGDGADFMEHVRQSYARTQITMDRQQVDEIRKHNLETINDQMRKREEGMNLKEKIEH